MIFISSILKGEYIESCQNLFPIILHSPLQWQMFKLYPSFFFNCISTFAVKWLYHEALLSLYKTLRYIQTDIWSLVLLKGRINKKNLISHLESLIQYDTCISYLDREFMMSFLWLLSKVDNAKPSFFFLCLFFIDCLGNPCP